MEDNNAPIFAFALSIIAIFLHVRHETGERYRSLKVIVPSAFTLSGRPLFSTDAQSVMRNRDAIRAYQQRQRAARANIKDLVYA